MAQGHVDGVIISDQAENVVYGQVIVDLVRVAKLPTIFPYREYFELGALMVYGTAAKDSWSRLPVYIDQILKGAHPGDLPFYLESKFDLLINLKSAKAIRVTIPPSLLVRADEVIK
jgi:putative tryptophan/tyrosine transport system substrate-binding protein